jgi:hypothetical protein
MDVISSTKIVWMMKMQLYQLVIHVILFKYSLVLFAVLNDLVHCFYEKVDKYY